MCYHNSLTEDSQKLENRYNAKFTIQEYKPIYHENGFNHNPRPVITNQSQNQFQNFQWGLIPYWTKNIRGCFKISK
ncbi:SOS response-associated peptidase family protein [Leptospira noguchii]|uniref:SOS response-associated peptidase family protein n=1 Tax=Leptospira noguchii TaxID=28182 RepID=UPI0006891B8F